MAFDERLVLGDDEVSGGLREPVCEPAGVEAVLKHSLTFVEFLTHTHPLLSGRTSWPRSNCGPAARVASEKGRMISARSAELARRDQRPIQLPGQGSHAGGGLLLQLPAHQIAQMSHGVVREAVVDV